MYVISAKNYDDYKWNDVFKTKFWAVAMIVGYSINLKYDQVCVERGKYHWFL